MSQAKPDRVLSVLTLQKLDLGIVSVVRMKEGLQAEAALKSTKKHTNVTEAEIRGVMVKSIGFGNGTGYNDTYRTNWKILRNGVVKEMRFGK